MAYSLSGRDFEFFVQRVALLETPSGFAIFHIDHKVFADPDGIRSWLTDATTAGLVLDVIRYVKVPDKSVTRRMNDGPGEELSELLREHWRSVSGKELYVEDEELRRVLKSNLGIKCCDENYVVSELMWGLKNLMYDLVFEERDNLTPGYHLPPCEGLKKCITEFKLNISPEDVDKEFLINAGGLYRCHTMLRTTGKDVCEACEPFVPGIGDLIEDDTLYAEVMSKILTPGLLPDWDFTEKFQDEELVLKLKAASAIAKDAREEVGYRIYHFIYATLVNLKNLPDIIGKAVEFLNSLVNERSVGKKSQLAGKRSHSEAVVGAAEEANGGQEVDHIDDADGERCKKARTD